jgi:hypothetical protein
MTLQSILILYFLLIPYQTAPIQSYVSKNFYIHYEKKIPSADMKELAGILEERLAYYQTVFNVKNTSRIDINVYTAIGRFRRESHSPVFNDGDCNDGVMYFVYQPLSINKEKITSVISRLVAKKVLEDIPWCPLWLTEAYSLYAGNDLLRFGHPIQMNMMTLTDLNEEYSRVSELSNAKELYAKLAATIHFLIKRYGEHKVETVIQRFKGWGTMENFFETIFNEKLPEIEDGWRQSLRTPYKDE